MRRSSNLIASVFAMFGALWFSGCQTVVSTAPAVGAYDKFAIVAADFASRPPATDLVVDVRPWKEATRTFALQRGDSVFEFPSGRSYFRTFQLPDSVEGKQLEIRSYYSKDFPTTLLVPAVRFLDNSGRPVGEVTAAPYEIRNVLGEHIKVRLTIPAGARRVTIYTTPERVAERMNFRTYSMAAAGPAPMFNAHQTGFGGFWEGFIKLSVEDAAIK